MSETRSRDRVRISAENTPVLESLGERTDAAAVFQNQAKAVVFAATIGYHFKKFEPVLSQTTKEILFQQIDRASDLGAHIDAVFALAHTGDMDVLASEDTSPSATDHDAALIFEGYVNGGLSHIRGTQGFDAAQPIKTVRDLVNAIDSQG